MKRALLAVMLISGLFALVVAQPKMKNPPVKLISSNGQVFMNAEWSPDGHAIAFTSLRYNGLYVCDREGHNIKKITSDRNAGFGFKWSLDSKTILARPVVEHDQKRYHQVVTYEIDNQKKNVLIDKTRHLKSLPVWVDNDASVSVLLNGQLTKINSGKVVLKSDVEDSMTLFQKNIVKGESSVELTDPKFNGRYVYNLVQSPDGNKVVFQVNGLGLFVANTDGSEMKHLGFGEQASWMPDGQFVVVVKVVDNGEVITKGQLEVVSVNSGQAYPLMCEKNIVALNPSVSPDGRYILLDNVLDGAVYLMEIQ